MELNIDLIPKRKRSNFTLAMGATAVILAITYFIIRIQGDKENSISQMPMMLYLFVYGIFGILHGLGYSVEKFFGSAYVKIDEERIAVKTGVWSKEQSILWNQIKLMEYKTNWFKIINLDDSSFKLALSDLEFKVLIETRNTINLIAAEKGITIK